MKELLDGNVALLEALYRFVVARSFLDVRVNFEFLDYLEFIFFLR